MSQTDERKGVNGQTRHRPASGAAGEQALARSVIRQALHDVKQPPTWHDAQEAWKWLTTDSPALAFWTALSGLPINTSMFRRFTFDEARRLLRGNGKRGTLAQ